MYSLLTEFRDGDNVVTTMMEHNSNYVPWYALCREILPRLGRRVECRLARFDPVTGELDLAHLAVADRRADQAGLLHRRVELPRHQDPAGRRSGRWPAPAGTAQPNGERRSYLLVDAAQLVPGSFVDVQALGVDYLAFSFHKLLAPFGVGVLYAREDLLAAALPFLYGGDMIAEGRVFPDQVEYNSLPWKYAAGTPNILGTIVSAQALRLLLDLALTPDRPAYFGTTRPLGRAAVRAAMGRIGLEPAADQPGARRARRHRRDHDLRAARRGPAHVAGRVQPRGPRSGRRGRGPEPGRGGVAGGLSLRDAGPPRPRAEPARELPPELLPLQHPGRGRPGRGRGGRHRRRPRPRPAAAGTVGRRVSGSRFRSWPAGRHRTQPAPSGGPNGPRPSRWHRHGAP